MVRLSFALAPALLIVHLTAASLSGNIGAGLSQMWALSPVQAMWLQLGFLIAYVLRIPLGGVVATIFSDRTVFLVAFVVSGLSSWLFFVYADDFVPALVLRIIAGAAAGAMVMPLFRLLGGDDLGRNIALIFWLLVCWAVSIYVSIMAGQINISAISAFIPPGGGWNTVFFLGSALSALWLVPFYFLLPRNK